MAELSVRFSNKINGYDKNEVDEFVKVAEAKLEEQAVALSELQAQVAELEERLSKVSGGNASVEEKVELYDRLMKKMDGDYKNLLSPAIAKAKAIEESAAKEYKARIDQARYTAEGVYEAVADRISDAVSHSVNQNMDRIYDMIGEYLESRSVSGRIRSFLGECVTAVSDAGQKVKTAILGSDAEDAEEI
jgi:DivIVA domain-containing protein